MQSEVLADALGMPYWTLWSWLRRYRHATRRADRPSASLVRVAVTRVVPAQRAVRSCVVTGPRGLSVTGLTIDELCALWRGLS